MPGEASAVKQIRAAGLDLPILGDEDLDGDYWKEAVPGLSDVYYSTYASIYGDDPDDQVNELVDRYKQETRQDPRHLRVPDRLCDGRGDQERGRGR